MKILTVAIDPLFGFFPGPRILIYHQVGTNFGREMEVSTDIFARQLDWIQAESKIIDLETAIELRGDSDADKFFVLTFDDGFEDVYQNAFPLMRSLRVPFTLYLTTRPIETGQPIDRRYPDARPFTWAQVAEMAESGLATVGAHTHTHPDLSTLTESQIVEELDTSNRLILDRTGIVPKHFTYPWGWWSKTADALVRERYASSTVGGAVKAALSEDPYLMTRFPVQRSDRMAFFARRMKHGFLLEERIRSVRSRYV